MLLSGLSVAIASVCLCHLQILDDTKSINPRIDIKINSPIKILTWASQV